LELSKDLDKKKIPQTIVNYCLARAYVSKDGFYHYCRDVLGYGDMYEPFHGPMATHVVDPTYKLYTPDVKEKFQKKNYRRFKMVQACRGSFKSSVCTVGYATWLIAREYTLTDACNIRILIGSEVLDLARKFVRTCRQIMENEPRYIQLFGDHKGDIKGRYWSDFGLTSQFRTLHRLGEPTISTISTDSPRAGNHYDVIIADDLETERKSASRDQIEKCWDFYRLLHSLLEPDGEMILVSTRWHYDDIYSRILKLNEHDEEDYQYCVFIMPAESKKRKLTFPTRFDKKHLEHLLQRHGTYLYSCQFLLDPVPDHARTFKKDWLKLVPPDIWVSKRRFRAFMGVDFAYTEQKRVESGEVKRADYTTIIVASVDDYWNYYIREMFRERCSVLRGITKMFDMYYNHKCINIGLQQFDRSQVDSVIIQHSHGLGKRPRYDYISYPVGKGKDERIRVTLQPLCEAGKMFLLPGSDWLEEEFLDFPRAAYDDGLDALCNLVKVSRPPAKLNRKEELTALQRHIASLKRGTIRYLDGTYKKDPGKWKRI
jgi:predicted phage terminase large subunit-like protein